MSSKKKNLLFFQRPFRTFQHRARLSISLQKKRFKKKKASEHFFSKFKDPMTLLIRRKISISNKEKNKKEKNQPKIKSVLTSKKFSNNQENKPKEKKKTIFEKKISRKTKKRIGKLLMKKGIWVSKLKRKINFLILNKKEFWKNPFFFITSTFFPPR